MALERLILENYRSIERMDLALGPLNALIGPNNSGKSNILRALDIVLGETWPSRPFTDRDFHGLDTQRGITITVLFTAPLRCDAEVRGFRLSFSQDYGVDYVAVDQDGNVCTWPRGGQKRVSNVMRAEVALLYLDLERLAERQLRANQWTLYGKLLREIERRIPAGDKEAFVTAVQEGLDAHLRAHLGQAQRVIDDLVRRQTGLQVELDFRAVDPLDVLRGVRPYVMDGAIVCDPEEVGAGVQSALAVAVAKAYTEIVRQPLVLAIEEPELYLHPHGCRHFYRLLRELVAQGLQVIYTTHSRSFVSASDFDSLHIVRKLGTTSTVTSGRGYAPAHGMDPLRLQSKFNERVNEVFFAAAVVLTEGDPDEIACRCALEREGFDLDRRSISVVSLGGKDEVATVAHLLVALGIPTFALLDEDPGNADSAATQAQVAAAVGAGQLLLQRPNLEGVFGLGRKLKRGQAMTWFPAWFGNAGNVMPQIYRDLAAEIQRVV